MPIIYPVPPVYLIDASSIEWQLYCGNGGAPIKTTPVTNAPVVPYILVNDIATNQQTWQLTIVPNPSPYPNVSPGDIHITPVTYDATATYHIQVNSPDGTLWWIEVAGGLLRTVFGTVQCTPEVGTLYYSNYNNIAWSQPGGIGTTVYPQQNTGSFGYPENQILMQEPGQGLWTGFCGHFYNCVTVWKDVDICTDQNIAILACPLCSGIFRIIEPYSAIEDPIQYYILIP